MEASDGSRARLAVVLRKREGLRAAFRESVKMVRTASAASGTIELLVSTAIAKRNGSAYPEGPCGRRPRSVAHSSIALCTNPANESGTLRVSRLMLEVGSKDWGIDF